QTELLTKLAARGFRVTQSSVSRDLREMHVAKADGRYVPPEALAAEAEAGEKPAPRADAFGLIRSVHAAGPNVLVVRTPPGSANVVGLAIDSARRPDVVEPVAGDDTIFIATASRGGQSRVSARIQQVIGH